MSEIQRFQWYHCRCGADEFYRAVKLKRHPQLGVSEEPSPTLRCVHCHDAMTTGELHLELRRQQLKQEIASREAELSSQEVPYAHKGAPVASAGTADAAPTQG